MRSLERNEPGEVTGDGAGAPARRVRAFRVYVAGVSWRAAGEGARRTAVERSVSAIAAVGCNGPAAALGGGRAFSFTAHVAGDQDLGTAIDWL
jgi:hypothetical protein